MNEETKIVNLCTTKVINRNDLYKSTFNIDNYEIDKENSVSLRELINKFNLLYKDFVKKIEGIEIIELDGEEYHNIDAHVSDEIDFKCATFTNKARDRELMLVNNEGNKYIKLFDYRGKTKKDLSSLYYVDEDLITKYTDIAEEYNLLLNAYFILKNNMIYGDGLYSIFTNINGVGEDIFKPLKEFNVTICDGTLNGGFDHYEESYNFIDNEYSKDDLKEYYISKDYLPRLYK